MFLNNKASFVLSWKLILVTITKFAGQNKGRKNTLAVAEENLLKYITILIKFRYLEPAKFKMQSK
jgi:hypothetical protein